MKYIKLCFRLLLGLFMTYAGYSHLTHARQEFVAQVPTWLQFSPGPSSSSSPCGLQVAGIIVRNYITIAKTNKL